MRVASGVWILVAGVGAVGCSGALGGGSSSLDHGSGGGDPRGSGGTGAGATSGGIPPDDGAGGVPALPPEKEERLEFEVPQAGARYVYAANPTRDTVSVIDSMTLQIRSVEAGDGPTFIRTVPGKDVALVINVGSRDLTVLRGGADGARTSTVPLVREGVNAIAVAPDGRHAIAWFDSRAGGSLGSLADVSLIRLGDGAAVPDRSFAISIRFRPVDVVFARDGGEAFVITEEYVSIIDFAAVTADAIAPSVRLADLRPTEVAKREVQVTPDGRFALERVEGSSKLTLVDLGNQAKVPLELGAPITDLDLAPDGAIAYAVLRQTGELARIDVPGDFAADAVIDRLSFPDEIVGSASVTGDGRFALLYTTAQASERLLIVDLAPGGGVRPINLKKAIRAVALSPDGKTAVIVHTKKPGDPAAAGIDLEEKIDRSHGYTVLDVATAYDKLFFTDADVGPLTITPDQDYLFVLLRDDARGVRAVERLALRGFQRTGFLLGSPPVAVAALSDTRRVFVSQEHPEGRISFINWVSGDITSVTGFELNGRIVE